MENKKEDPQLPIDFRYNISQLEWPGLHIMVGMTGSGKTSLLKWILYEYAKKRLWHRVYVFCPTGLLKKEDPKYRNYYHMLDTKFIYADPDKYQSIFNKIYELQQKNEKRRVLMIFDDCIGSVKFRDDFFTKVAILGRHISISTILLTQYLGRVPAPLRTNACTYFIFKTTGPNIEHLAEFNVQFTKTADFKKKLMEWISTKYNCCRINVNSKMEQKITFFKSINMDKDFYIEQE